MTDNDESEDELPGIVLDSGSGSIHAGFAGDDAPRVTIPTTVARLGDSIKIGETTQSHEGQITYPMERGVVQKWDDMERIWHHVFHHELGVEIEEHNVLLTEPPRNPKTNKEKMAEIMFESFVVPSMHVQNDGVLSCYSAGRTGAIVLCIGHGVTSVMPICEGYLFPTAIRRQNIGGVDLDEYMGRLLMERGDRFKLSGGDPRDCKEKMCYVAPDLEDCDCKSKDYQLPDGKVIAVTDERIQCPEALFHPKMMGKGAQGIHELVYESIVKCTIDTRAHFYGNVVLSGGCTMFEGLSDRLEQELNELAPDSANVKVIAPPERRIQAWIGGSIVASLSSFQDRWITRAEYEEQGKHIWHNKNVW